MTVFRYIIDKLRETCLLLLPLSFAPQKVFKCKKTRLLAILDEAKKLSYSHYNNSLVAQSGSITLVLQNLPNAYCEHVQQRPIL